MVIPDGYGVYHWPETQALFTRLGVDFRQSDLREIHLLFSGPDEPVTVVYQPFVAGEERRRLPNGWDVYQWEEFQNFCRRIGFPWHLPTVSCSFKIVEGETVSITHVYLGADNGQQAALNPDEAVFVEGR